MMRDAFDRFSRKATAVFGSALTNIVYIVGVLVWLALGIPTRFSDTWQLVANTVTTLVMTWLGLLILATQNRDAAAIHAKLDELLLRLPQTDNRFAGLEEADQEAFKQRQAELAAERENA